MKITAANKNHKIGGTVRYGGRVFQILTINNRIMIAHSYDEHHGIDDTIFITQSTGSVFATKAVRRKNVTEQNQ